MSDDPKPYVPKIDRRTAIAWIGAVGAATGAGVVVSGCAPGEKPAKGYGTDPNLVKPAKAPWPRLLSKTELQAAAILCDFILPASGTAPAATALGVPDFIDEWVSAPYPDQLKDRPIIRDGLKPLIEVMSDAGQRTAWLAALPKATDEATKAFFRRFRYLVVGAYYTTQEGFRDIGYIGNESRAADPGPSAEAKAAVEQALVKLGL
ncbi:gluconate 2-dehydrogenase subunit 3 family protein [Phenylobacterium sp.]|uniref:gluconate 2-dehydrogenase subunit 3 family protein n=1 Tax=Phenylobacterium sp. TaxID=1871053 RepID=UPI0025EE8502|nr:gluconate 2-dehydrogenase subunit 3 family protein [Phenylobacterium sp.]MBX3485355.1 gluconate 2-dehydrogenase subunit 3 family protein [Phenylobacterium sp.]MCW5760101.1 gluconate 2-dehydrogenase subunit 3 family protein [Phenylobacterium sp.]